MPREFPCARPSASPFSSTFTINKSKMKMFFLTSFISLDVIFLSVAGWASGNKFSLLGAVRSAAQMVSYEAPLAFCVLSVTVLTGSLDVAETVLQQKQIGESLIFPEFSATWSGFLAWNVIKFPVLLPVFLIFFITTLAQANRAPFDVPEAESEIIAGFMTEYSGFRWAVFMLSEYALMLLSSYWAVLIFFGGWLSPFSSQSFFPENSFFAQIEAFLWLHLKVLFVVFLQMWLRWTFPRMRADILMSFAWKKLLPASILLFMSAAAWRFLTL